MRLTISCPVAMIPDANQLARCLGLSGADDQTFGAATWQDASANRYAAASFEASDAWFSGATSPLIEPEWGCDLAAASRAQAAIVLWIAEGETEPPLAALGKLTVVAGLDGRIALASMGLRAANDASGG